MGSHSILHCLPGYCSWVGVLSETFTQVPIGCNRCILLQDTLSCSLINLPYNKTTCDLTLQFFTSYRLCLRSYRTLNHKVPLNRNPSRTIFSSSVLTFEQSSPCWREAGFSYTCNDSCVTSSAALSDDILNIPPNTSMSSAILMGWSICELLPRLGSYSVPGFIRKVCHFHPIPNRFPPLP